MSSEPRFMWPRRMRWQLIGAWRWPAFVLLTVGEGFLARALPPAGTQAKLIPSILICGFGNLFLLGVVAPWLGRRLAGRQAAEPAQATFPPSDHGEIVVDRVATVLLGVGALGVLVAGIGNHPVVIADSKEQGQAVAAAKAFVLAHAPGDVQANAQSGRISNPHEMSNKHDFFRVCVAHRDPHTAYCMFVNTRPAHPVVRPDPNPATNATLFPSER